MAFKLIYPAEQSGKPLVEGEPVSPQDYCAIETEIVSLDGISRTQYVLQEKRGGLFVKINATPLPLATAKTRFLDVLFPEREISEFGHSDPLNVRLMNGRWVCFEGNPEERTIFRKLIEEQLEKVCDPDALQKRYGFRSFKIKELGPEDQRLEELVETLRDDWGSKDKGTLPKAKYLETIYVLRLDENTLHQLASQDYGKEKFWLGVLFLTKLNPRIVVFGPPGSFTLTEIASAGVAMGAPLETPDATLITHERKEVQRKLA